MNLYTKLSEKVMKEAGIDSKELLKRIRKAQQYHNPLNYSSGTDIAEENGWSYLFTDALEMENAGRRYYFKFHDYDLTDVDTCYRAFKNCRNFKKYSKIWMKHAPKGVNRPEIYLLALVEMTVRGFKHEENVIDQLVSRGHEVIASSAADDLKGVDIWVDGKPVQIKSLGTFRNMKDEHKTIETIGAIA